MEKLRQRQSERLKILKTEQNLTQQELGEAMCVTQQLVSKIILGKASIREEQANLLEKAYGYRADWLLGLDSLKTKDDFRAEAERKSMINIITDLAERAGYSPATVSFTWQDEVVDKSFGRLSHIHVTDPVDGTQGSLEPRAIEWMGRRLTEYARYLIWVALRLPDEDDEKVQVIEDLGAWLRGEDNGEE